MEHFNPILGNDTPGQKFITCGEIMLRLTPPNYEKIRMASSFEASGCRFYSNNLYIRIL